MSDNPAVALEFREPGFNSANTQQMPRSAPQLVDLWGIIRQVSAAPAWTPRGRLEESIALYNSGGTRRLYIYDYDTATWHYSSLT